LLIALAVEFPAMTPGWMIRQHQWHLACEFTNWIEAVRCVSGRVAQEEPSGGAKPAVQE
jgi:hypothetical protein